MLRRSWHFVKLKHMAPALCFCRNSHTGDPKNGSTRTQAGTYPHGEPQCYAQARSNMREYSPDEYKIELESRGIELQVRVWVWNEWKS